MTIYNFILILVTIVLCFFDLNGQALTVFELDEECEYLSFNLGVQISGIKDEDFVVSNVAPLINISLGKNFSEYFGAAIGYKGFYFNYIADDFKHYYQFLYVDCAINITKIWVKSARWNLILYGGPGFFYNHHYDRGNMCLNIGSQLYYQVNERIKLNFDISSIVGWDLYQGNLDILPGVTAGTTYLMSIY